MTARQLSLCAIALLGCAGAASAGVGFALDDNRYLPSGAEDPVVYIVGTYPFGFDPNSLSYESGPNFPEQFDLHGEYFTMSQLPLGFSLTVNFNFFDDPALTFCGDTLSITFTGHEPSAVDFNNMSVDLHFRSDLNELGLTPLDGPIPPVNLFEVDGFMQLDSYIVSHGGPVDFSIAVQSVPAPSTLALVAGCGMIGLRRRR